MAAVTSCENREYRSIQWIVLSTLWATGTWWENEDRQRGPRSCCAFPPQPFNGKMQFAVLWKSRTLSFKYSSFFLFFLLMNNNKLTPSSLGTLGNKTILKKKRKPTYPRQQRNIKSSVFLFQPFLNRSNERAKRQKASSLLRRDVKIKGFAD